MPTFRWARRRAVRLKPDTAYVVPTFRWANKVRLHQDQIMRGVRLQADLLQSGHQSPAYDRSMRPALLALLLVTSVGARAQQQPPPPLPDFNDFAAQVKARLSTDDERQSGYTFRERRVEQRLDGKGRVTSEAIKVYEVYPGLPGEERYRRLIEQDGKPVARIAWPSRIASGRRMPRTMPGRSLTAAPVTRPRGRRPRTAPGMRRRSTTSFASTTSACCGASRSTATTRSWRR